MGHGRLPLLLQFSSVVIISACVEPDTYTGMRIAFFLVQIRKNGNKRALRCFSVAVPVILTPEGGGGRDSGRCAYIESLLMVRLTKKSMIHFPVKQRT